MPQPTPASPPAAEPDTVVDLPTSSRIRPNPAGSLWHLLEAGLLDGEAAIDVFGHDPAPAPQTFCLWHVSPTCYTPVRRKRAAPMPARTIVETLLGRARYTPCSCLERWTPESVPAADRAAVAWLLDTDTEPSRPELVLRLLQSLREVPDLTDVTDSLATRVRRRHMRRTAQIRAAAHERQFQLSAIDDLVHHLRRGGAGVAHGTLAASLPAADSARASRHVAPMLDAAERWHAAWTDDLATSTAAPAPSASAVPSALDPDNDDSEAGFDAWYPGTHRGALHGEVWDTLCGPGAWFGWLDAPAADGRGPWPDALGCVLDRTEDHRAYRVPLAYLAVAGRGRVPGNVGVGGHEVLGLDRGYRSDAVAQAHQLRVDAGDVGSFADLAAALTAAADTPTIP